MTEEDFKKQYRDTYWWLCELWLAVQGDRNLQDTMESAYTFICNRTHITTNSEEVFAYDDIVIEGTDEKQRDFHAKELLSRSMRFSHSQICLHRTIPDDQEWWCVCFSDYEERDDDDMDAYPLGKYRGD